MRRYLRPRGLSHSINRKTVGSFPLLSIRHEQAPSTFRIIGLYQIADAMAIGQRLIPKK